MYAKRMSKLGTETAFEVLLRARKLEAQGRDVVHLEIGEPDFNTPDNIIQAAIQALKSGWTHYGPAAGLPALREAIAEHIAQTRGIPVAPEQVVVVPGAKPIIFFSILAFVDVNDEVIYPNPGFPIYESMINFAGARPVPIRLQEDKDFRLDINELADRLSDKTRMIILNSPHNPTGGVIPSDDLQALADLVRHRDLLILSDEIYSRILYEGRHDSIARFPGLQEKTIILDGFSKTYAMTGWRLGYGVMDRERAEKVTKLMINSNSCTASFTQVAGVEALRGEQSAIEKLIARFRSRRDVIVAGLNAVPGFTCRNPQGAFYVFPNITGTGMDSKTLADWLLEKAGVACLAGTAFGANGEGYLRLSYANSVENIHKALRRIGEAVAALRAP